MMEGGESGWQKDEGLNQGCGEAWADVVCGEVQLGKEENRLFAKGSIFEQDVSLGDGFRNSGWHAHICSA